MVTANSWDDAPFMIKLDAAGNALWSHAFPTTLKFGDGARPDGVAIDGAGDIFVSGALMGTVDLGLGPLAAASGGDAFLAKFDPTGKALSSVALPVNAIRAAPGRRGRARRRRVDRLLRRHDRLRGGAADQERARHLAMGTFAARFDGSGKCLWSQQFGGPSLDGSDFVVVVSSIGANGAGGVSLVGALAGTADFAGKTLTVQHGSLDASTSTQRK